MYKQTLMAEQMISNFVMHRNLIHPLLIDKAYFDEHIVGVKDIPDEATYADMVRLIRLNKQKRFLYLYALKVHCFRYQT